MTEPPRIQMRPYDQQWPAEFDHLAQRLSRALEGLDVRVDHVGSTSVPGLSAKDVIDVQITVHDLSDNRLDERLVAIGVVATDLTTDHVPPGAEGNVADWTKRYFRAPSRRTDE